MSKKAAFITALILAGGLFSGFRALKQSTAVVPCANSGQCNATPKLEADNSMSGNFMGQVVTPPSVDLSARAPKNVLGEETGVGEKHIYVDLATQTLTAYQGSTLFMTATVSTGKWNPTPPGDYTIWVKLRATRMSGGEGADAYDLPNVPWVMFFYNDHVSKGDGYSLHGAYWHDNFGHPMSHGCVNMRQVDAEKLYNWVGPEGSSNIIYADTVNTGTKVTIR